MLINIRYPHTILLAKNTCKIVFPSVAADMAMNALPTVFFNAASENKSTVWLQTWMDWS